MRRAERRVRGKGRGIAPEPPAPGPRSQRAKVHTACVWPPKRRRRLLQEEVWAVYTLARTDFPHLQAGRAARRV